MLKSDWHGYAEMLGRIILKRNWRKTAQVIFKSKINELNPAVQIYKSLLSNWQRFLLSFNKDSKNLDHQKQIIHRIAELGTSLAYDQLDFIWQRAGGEPKDLISNHSYKNRWIDAAHKASNGSLYGGLKSILNILLGEFPNNEDLLELKSLLTEETYTHLPQKIL